MDAVEGTSRRAKLTSALKAHERMPPKMPRDCLVGRGDTLLNR